MQKKTTRKASPVRKKTTKPGPTDAQRAARENFQERRHTTTVAILAETWESLLDIAARARDRGKPAPSMNLAINALLRDSLKNDKAAIATIRAAAGTLNLPRGRKA